MYVLCLIMTEMKYLLGSVFKTILNAYRRFWLQKLKASHLINYVDKEVSDRREPVIERQSL